MQPIYQRPLLVNGNEILATLVVTPPDRLNYGSSQLFSTHKVQGNDNSRLSSYRFFRRLPPVSSVLGLHETRKYPLRERDGCVTCKGFRTIQSIAAVNISMF